MQRTGLLVLSIILFQVGCDSNGASNPPGKVAAPHDQSGEVKDGVAGRNAPPPTVEPPATGATDVGGSAAPLVVDTRTPVTPDKTPPPISGGTLLVLQDGVTAVAADPDRDRVSVIDLPSARLVGHVALKAGDEPGRLVEDAAGFVHVALRGAGAIATINVGKLKVTERRSACGSPRGIAYDAAADSLHVACTDGDLVTLPASGGSVTQRVRIEPDLRDVLVRADGKLMVSKFKSATLLRVDADGAVTERTHPTDNHVFIAIGRDAQLTGARSRPFQPSLARRVVAMANGKVAMLHARELADTVEVPDPHDPSSMTANSNGVFMGAPTPDGSGSFAVPGGGNAYGGGGTCNAIVQTGVSIVDEQGGILESANIASSALPVDLAVSPDGTMIAIANAGSADPGAPFNGGMFPAGSQLPPLPPGAPGFAGGGFVNSFNGAGGSLGTVNLLSSSEPTFHSDGEIGTDCSGNAMSVPGQPTAVAFAPDGALLVQSREPANITLVTASNMVTIELGGDSVLDTGHELFHRDAGAGLACASCHGEAGDDGHVWQFSDSGERRTQSVNVGLSGTQPFHWSGDMTDLPMLVDRVFVGRMGGASQSPERVDALSHWLFAQQPPERIRAADDTAAVRGKALFKSAEVGCADCHSGAKLTNNKTVDVGTGGAFQVPSLIGVGYRAPFLHDGCAQTLRDRFNPACGGDKHGNTKQLSDKQVGDLTAYLETL